jgi:hypothetical protein
MTTRTRVFCRVPVRGTVATPRHSAGLTGSEVYPTAPNLYALVTLAFLRKLNF